MDYHLHLSNFDNKKYSNNLFAFTCGLLLGGSGLFHIQTMALSHGVVTFVGMLIIYLITRNDYLISKKISSKHFFTLSMILYIGFLFFNTLILVAFMLHLIQFFLIIKHKNIRIELRNFILISLLITSFYIIYYLIFLGIPYLMVNNQEFIFFGIPTPLVALFFNSLIFNSGIYKNFLSSEILLLFITFFSIMMVVNIKFISLKFKDYSFFNNIHKYILLLISLFLLLYLKLDAFPIIVIIYILISLVYFSFVKNEMN